MINITVTKLPLLNQRNEYAHYKEQLRDPNFRHMVDEGTKREFACGKFVWAGVMEGVSVLLQRVVLGVEAWIPSAVLLELACQDRLTPETVEKVNDPFSLKARGTAATYFNALPSQIDDRHALKETDPELWELMRTFYRDIRNPLFHGSYISSLKATDLDYIFGQFDRVYAWCDSWCDVSARLKEVGRRSYDPSKYR